MKVPFFDLVAQHQTIRQEVLAEITRVFDSQQFIMGADVEAFEKDAAAYCQTRHAIGCASGSDALLLALMALGVGPGDEVITVPFTFFATTSAITRLGAKVVYVDVRADDFNLDVARLEAAITPRTKAIMPVHLFGQCARMDEIRAIAARYAVPVIEDAAQAIGSDFGAERAGTMGLIGCFSFFPTKNLGGAGDAGLLTTNDDQLADRLRILRVHGMQPKYYHQVVGINSRIDVLQAVVLRVKLRYLDQWIDARQRNAAHYNRFFAQAGIAEVAAPLVYDDVRHTFHQYTIRAARRDELKKFLQEAGIGAEVYYPVPLHLQECFKFLGYREGDLPVSEQLSREVMSLPIYPELAAEQLDYIVEKIDQFYHSL